MSWIENCQNFMKKSKIPKDLMKRYKHPPIEEHIKFLDPDKNYFISFSYEYNELLDKCQYKIGGKITGFCPTSKKKKTKHFSYGGVLPLKEMENLLNVIVNYSVECPFLRLSGYSMKKFLRIIGFYIEYYGT